MKNLESYSAISTARAKDSFVVHSLLVKGFKIGTRNFVSLKIGVLIADKIGKKDGQLSTISL